MKFRFASWNVNSRKLQPTHVALLHEIGADLVALQEVSSSFHAALADANPFDWSASSLSKHTMLQSEGPSRQLGCSVFGRAPFELESFSTLGPLDFPERTLAARVRAPSVSLTVCSFHIPPGSSWGQVKPNTMKFIGQWLSEVKDEVVVGMDANAPKSDHPDITRNTWWWPGEPLLLGSAPIHHLMDAFRSFLATHPAELTAIKQLRPNGPLEITHVRGKSLKRTPCRYDFIYCTPSTIVDSISHLYERSLAAGSDHALVMADLRIASAEGVPRVEHRVA